ncbi:MAG: hypothetical protein FJ137_10675 [Deltaproteobacteria bacterium]|nr:hypothetical protein [Deltaproteobacteria bacterium]
MPGPGRLVLVNRNLTLTTAATWGAEVLFALRQTPTAATPFGSVGTTGTAGSYLACAFEMTATATTLIALDVNPPDTDQLRAATSAADNVAGDLMLVRGRFAGDQFACGSLGPARKADAAVVGPFTSPGGMVDGAVAQIRAIAVYESP